MNILFLLFSYPKPQNQVRILMYRNWSIMCINHFLCTVCPKALASNETSGVIYSPGFPRGHPTNVTCSWQITGRKGHRLQLEIEYLDIEPSKACKRNYLEIPNSSFEDGTPSGRIYGVLFGRVTVYSNLESLKVLFVYDDNWGSSGFKATYRQLKYTVSTGK